MADWYTSAYSRRRPSDGEALGFAELAQRTDETRAEEERKKGLDNLAYLLTKMSSLGAPTSYATPPEEQKRIAAGRKTMTDWGGSPEGKRFSELSSREGQAVLKRPGVVDRLPLPTGMRPLTPAEQIELERLQVQRAAKERTAGPLPWAVQVDRGMGAGATTTWAGAAGEYPTRESTERAANMAHGVGTYVPPEPEDWGKTKEGVLANVPWTGTEAGRKYMETEETKRARIAAEATTVRSAPRPKDPQSQMNTLRTSNLSILTRRDALRKQWTAGRLTSPIAPEEVEASQEYNLLGAMMEDNLSQIEDLRKQAGLPPSTKATPQNITQEYIEKVKDHKTRGEALADYDQYKDTMKAQGADPKLVKEAIEKQFPKPKHAWYAPWE